MFLVLYVSSFTWIRYQVSVYRTIGPLVFNLASVETLHHGDSEDELSTVTYQTCSILFDLMLYVHGKQLRSSRDGSWASHCMQFKSN